MLFSWYFPRIVLSQVRGRRLRCSRLWCKLLYNRGWFTVFYHLWISISISTIRTNFTSVILTFYLFFYLLQIYFLLLVIAPSYLKFSTSSILYIPIYISVIFYPRLILYTLAYLVFFSFIFNPLQCTSLLILETFHVSFAFREIYSYSHQDTFFLHHHLTHFYLVRYIRSLYVVTADFNLFNVILSSRIQFEQEEKGRKLRCV